MRAFRNTSAWYRFKRFVDPGSWSDADPHKVIYISVDAVREKLRDTTQDESGVVYQRHWFHKYRNMGRVLAGDWDTRRVDLDRDFTHRLIRERYAEGVPWEETQVFQLFLQKIAAGEVVWHGCSSRAALLARCADVDRLFDSIRRRGYRPQAELPRGERRRWLDELTVNIDREGGFLLNCGGSHRRAIAKVLGIEQIPVHVLVRHRRWQDVREAIRRSTRGGDPSLHIEAKHLRHPDLQDIIPEKCKSADVMLPDPPASSATATVTRDREEPKAQRARRMDVLGGAPSPLPRAGEGSRNGQNGASVG